jgi:hypothetical protein
VRFALGAGPLAALLLLAARPGAAADLFVAEGGADGPSCDVAAPCATLAHALTLAAPAGGDTIHVGDGTFAAATVVDRPVTIEGAAATVLDGGGLAPVLRWERAGDLVLRRLTIRNGNGGVFDGGGLHLVGGAVLLEDCVLTGNGSRTATAVRMTDGTLTLRRTTVSDNGAVDGGSAVHVMRTTLLVEDCVVVRNEGSANGIGINCNAGCVATIARTSIRSNHSTVASARGAGLMVFGVAEVSSSIISDNEPTGILVSLNPSGPPGNLTLLGSTVSGNSDGGISSSGVLVVRDSVIRDNAGTSYGAGLRTSGTTLVERSAIVRNLLATPSGGGGAGIMVTDSTSSQGVLTIVNSTISGNVSDARGGGIYALSGAEIEVVHSTIAFNVAQASGGGMDLTGVGSCEVSGSLVAGNSAAGGSDDIEGTWISLGHSIIGDGAGWAASGGTATDLVGVDPLLAPLASNGGPTPSHALRAGSPAIDSVDPAGCVGPDGAPLLQDQRGVVRPADGDCDGDARCDRGAVEAAPCGTAPLTLYEAASPVDVASPGNAVASPAASPYEHVPAPGTLLFYQLDDGSGSPGLIFVQRAPAGLMFTW